MIESLVGGGGANGSTAPAPDLTVAVCQLGPLLEEVATNLHKVEAPSCSRSEPAPRWWGKRPLLVKVGALPVVVSDGALALVAAQEAADLSAEASLSDATWDSCLGHRADWPVW